MFLDLGIGLVKLIVEKKSLNSCFAVISEAEELLTSDEPDVSILVVSDPAASELPAILSGTEEPSALPSLLDRMVEAISDPLELESSISFLRFVLLHPVIIVSTSDSETTIPRNFFNLKLTL